MKLLIVEDSPLIVERIKKILADIIGLEIIGETGSVKEAEYLIMEEKPDILILDIHLQGGSGLSIQYMIHSQKLKVNTIILTNFSSPILKEKSFELGAKYFLDKSNDFEKLENTVKEILDNN